MLAMGLAADTRIDVKLLTYMDGDAEVNYYAIRNKDSGLPIYHIFQVSKNYSGNKYSLSTDFAFVKINNTIHVLGFHDSMRMAYYSLNGDVPYNGLKEVMKLAYFDYKALIKRARKGSFVRYSFTQDTNKIYSELYNAPEERPHDKFVLMYEVEYRTPRLFKLMNDEFIRVEMIDGKMIPKLEYVCRGKLSAYTLLESRILKLIKQLYPEWYGGVKNDEAGSSDDIEPS